MSDHIVDEAWLTELVTAWPGAEAGEKPEWETFVLTVAGKIFGIFGVGSGELLLTLKGDPLDNEALRQEFPEVVPGYHVNKKHWISVLLADSTLSRDHLAELIEESYALVFASLTKKLQAELRETHRMNRLTRGEE
ncbi:MAG: MmcQ/YjbR family DNA-binding protein [Actinobacteria bacterium]|nr:MmcQ/YjbR family DNA-binding protein [Actinomycetota bacterium]